MSDRLEYSGDPLPSGLPGFGGGTVDILILPGFNRVVAPQKFGPVNNAPTVTPPDPTPPTGSNPENPTNEVVAPGPAPVSQSGTSSNFCERCVPPDFQITGFPLMKAEQADSACVDCQGNKPGKVAEPGIAAFSNKQGIFWDGNSGIEGKEPGGKEWSITDTELKLDGDIGGVILNEAQLVLGLGGGQETFYQAGPEIIAPDGLRYTPKEIDICISGSRQKWKILAVQL
jgi:hypothetical protein